MADVQNPIIGADFLRHYNLLVDLKGRRLVDNETSLHIEALDSDLPDPTCRLPTSDDRRFAELLRRFPDVIQPHSPHDHSVKYNVQHHIETKGQPTFSKPRRLAPD